ncbi:hypothetical protein MIR68_004091 [Amoeboaphelidium protococcarum]|nr:hypothetical protein MIR68_004091 [Amoeboaphelidium protococcarum]
MLVTGTANTLLNKFQDKQCVRDCNNGDNKPIYYTQPVWQTLTVFFGNFLCMLVYLLNNVWPKIYQQKQSVRNDDDLDQDAPLISTISQDDTFQDQLSVKDDDSVNIMLRKELTGRSCFLLWLPTVCDIIATTLVNVGLLAVAASVYSMLRGSVVIFTGALSFLILRVKLPLNCVIALLAVMVGVTLVGLAPWLFQDAIDDAQTQHQSFLNPAIGVLFIICAQLSAALQFVIEEKILVNYSAPPIKLIGLEGTFGLLTLLLLMPLFHVTFGKDTGGYFDLVTGYEQLVSYPKIWGSSIGCAVSVALFNCFGLNVTRFISATSRTTIDTCRTLFIWLISLALSWEDFIWLQVIGFALMIYGTFVFNGVMPLVPTSITRLLCSRRQLSKIDQ